MQENSMLSPSQGNSRLVFQALEGDEAGRKRESYCLALTFALESCGQGNSVVKDLEVHLALMPGRSVVVEPAWILRPRWRGCGKPRGEDCFRPVA